MDTPAARVSGLAGGLPPIALAAAAQILALGATLALEGSLSGWSTPFMLGVLAAALGQAFGLPAWWLPLNLLFAPAAQWLHGLALAPGWFLGAFMVLALLFWTTHRTRVPLFLSTAEACERLVGLLPARPGVRVIDLGCGLGDVLLRLARARPDGAFAGAELAPVPALVAWLRTRGLRNAQVTRSDFWRESLAAYDVVYAFLSPAAMPALWSKARAEMRPGSLLISNSFAIPDVAPDRVVPLSGRGSRALYLWRM